MLAGFICFILTSPANNLIFTMFLYKVENYILGYILRKVFIVKIFTALNSV